MAESFRAVNWKHVLLKETIFLEKNTQARYDYTMAELVNDPQQFFEVHRLSPRQFNDLLQIIGPHLKERRHSAALCLTLSLWYLSSGERCSAIFNISKSDGDTIISNVLDTIEKILKGLVFSDVSPVDVENLAVGFEETWNFPNCIGALETRTILCKDYSRFGVEVVMDLPFAIISDANYRFIVPAISTQYDLNKLQGWQQIPLLQIMDNVNLNVWPKLKKHLPLVIVAPEGFPLIWNIMRPYLEHEVNPKREVYNFRHHRALSPVATALGILFTHWKIFQSPVIGHPIDVHRILQCTIALHNWLINQEIALPNSERNYLPKDLLHEKDEHGYLLKGDWHQRSITSGVEHLPNYDETATQPGALNRSTLRRYFRQEGQIPIQPPSGSSDEETSSDST